MATNRPRGFQDWQPQAKSAALLEDVQQVMQTYRHLLPLTARQIFYRLVATTGYEKTEQAYERLLNMLNRARRARLLDMAAIRDDGAIVAGDNKFSGPTDFLENCARWADSFQLDLMQYQPQRVELLCEAGGMVPQLERIGRDYGVIVRSSGGFDSTTVKHQLGRLYGQEGKPVVVLHVGDLDPSGEHIFLNLAEDLGAFTAAYGGHVDLVRVAVTAEQQAEHGLPTAPPKKKDKRSFSADFTVQAEALPPDTLARIVRKAIEQQIDSEALREALSDQEDHRRELSARVRSLLAETD
jgi:DNA topoisomerase VI subunit A